MEPWLDDLIKIAITSGVVLVGSYWANKARKRAQVTQETQAEIQKEFGLTDKWRDWAQEQVEARENVEKEVKELKATVKSSQEDISKLSQELEKFRGWIDGLVAYIQDLLEWAKDAQHNRPRPRIPKSIAHLIPKENPHD